MPAFDFMTTHVGSVPYADPVPLADQLASLLDIPAWTQHPRRSFRESMYVQYSPTLPGITVDEVKEKVILDTRNDLTPALEDFYGRYLSDDLDAFALQPDHAAGFFAMLAALERHPGRWAKGQVTGPISFGLTVTDQNLRASLYDDLLADPIVKNTAMVARWQVRALKQARPEVIIFLDEPYMASFGSAFISLGRDQVIAYLNEVFDGIHAEGALAGIHCCANTDWGLLLATGVDILNLDAYGFIENLALYPDELRDFISRGGSICWGVVPNNEQILTESPAALAQRLRDGLQLIIAKAAGRGVQINADDLSRQSLIAPACGLGSSSVEIADRVFATLAATGELLKRG